MKRIYIDLDGVCADLQKQADKKYKENPLMKYPQAEYGFFMEMEPIEDAVIAVKTLAEHYDVWFLSAPSWRNPLCLAEKNYWVRQHFGLEWAERLILCSDKSLLKGDYLIDDHQSGRGQDKFEGELIHFGAINTPNSQWVEIFEYLVFEDFLMDNGYITDTEKPRERYYRKEFNKNTKVLIPTFTTDNLQKV